LGEGVERPIGHLHAAVAGWGAATVWEQGIVNDPSFETAVGLPWTAGPTTGNCSSSSSIVYPSMAWASDGLSGLALEPVLNNSPTGACAVSAYQALALPLGSYRFRYDYEELAGGAPDCGLFVCSDSSCVNKIGGSSHPIGPVINAETAAVAVSTALAFGVTVLSGSAPQCTFVVDNVRVRKAPDVDPVAVLENDEQANPCP
jgi:hypothetical protein